LNFKLEAVEINLKLGRLRSWEKEDAAALVQHANNPKIAANMRDGFPYPYTLKNANDWLDAVLKDEKNIFLAIEMDGEAIGGIGIIPFGDVYRKGAEIGYWLSETYWNRGIATDAINQLVNHAFKFAGLIRISACVFEKNKTSMHVLEKAGFHLESIHKKAVFKNGELLDEFVYVRLNESV